MKKTIQPLVNIPSKGEKDAEIVRDEVRGSENQVELRSRSLMGDILSYMKLLTSNTAVVTTFFGDGMSLSMLRYLLTSSIACFIKLASSVVCSDRTSSRSSSPRSGGAIETVAQATAEIKVHMYNASEN